MTVRVGLLKKKIILVLVVFVFLDMVVMDGILKKKLRKKLKQNVNDLMQWKSVNDEKLCYKKWR